MPKLAEKLSQSTTRRKKTNGNGDDQPRERKIKYSEVKAKIGWLKAAQAKTFLGWMQPEDGQEFKEYLLKDRNGVATKCTNVAKQRPFYPALAAQYMGEILGMHWNGDGDQTNGEAIVIGKTALAIEGKHRLVAEVLAAQEWLNHPEKYPQWKEEPKIHVCIMLGVREDIKAINTLNTGKPRSLGDAIYASGLFGEMTGSRSKDKAKIQKLSKMADHAVRLVWHRTGARRDAFAPKRTHAESLDFIQRHPKILECVHHIYKESGNDDKLKYFPSPGYAAGLLYLMGSSQTDRENDDMTGYMQVDCPTEDLLDWSMWDTACEFWTLLADNDEKSMSAIREVNATYLDSEGGSFLAERIAILVKAWWCFSSEETLAITRNAIELDTEMNNDGREKLIECPTVGEMFGEVCSIDLGEPPRSSD